MPVETFLILAMAVALVAVGLIIYLFYRIFSAQRKSRAKSSLSANAPSTPVHPPSAQPKITVNLLPEVKKSKAATEMVNVPVGVTITVKRSRQVEHTIDIGHNKSLEGNIEMGLKGILSSSILGKMEQTQGRSYQQTETMEYEILLNGEKSNQYKLTWVDTFFTGTIEVQQGGVTQSIPFQFREGTELEVIPISQSAA
jgi:hypothetical protein